MRVQLSLLLAIAACSVNLAFADPLIQIEGSIVNTSGVPAGALTGNSLPGNIDNYQFQNFTGGGNSGGNAGTPGGSYSASQETGSDSWDTTAGQFGGGNTGMPGSNPAALINGLSATVTADAAAVDSVDIPATNPHIGDVPME